MDTYAALDLHHTIDVRTSNVHVNEPQDLRHYLVRLFEERVDVLVSDTVLRLKIVQEFLKSPARCTEALVYVGVHAQREAIAHIAHACVDREIAVFDAKVHLGPDVDPLVADGQGSKVDIPRH
eukprot:scaffold253767_cov35-Tisochrysis_lutea.AAC.2